MCCTNASDLHKLTLLVIGKAKNSQFFKGTEQANLPVDYCSQTGAWIDHVILKDGFDTKFVPRVCKQLRSQGLPETAVLLLDNAPSHPMKAF